MVTGDDCGVVTGEVCVVHVVTREDCVVHMVTGEDYWVVRGLLSGDWRDLLGDDWRGMLGGG